MSKIVSQLIETLCGWAFMAVGGGSILVTTKVFLEAPTSLTFTSITWHGLIFALSVALMLKGIEMTKS